MTLRERVLSKSSAAAREAFLGLCAACANEHCNDCLDSMAVGHILIECACGCKPPIVVQRAGTA